MSKTTFKGLVARDAHGPIYLYPIGSKLYRYDNMWNGDRILYLGNKETLPEVSWEDEPYAVDITVEL